jgi:HSP20 family protein
MFNNFKIDLRTIMTHIRELPASPFDILVKNFFTTDSFFAPAMDVKIGHPVDIYETKEGLCFEIAGTGLTKEDIDINIEGDLLRVSYTKKDETKEGVNYIHKGIAKRSFNLGYKIARKYDLNSAEATMKDGLLKISIPFAEESKPKSLKIK